MTLTFTVEVEVDNNGEKHVPYILQLLKDKLVGISYGTKVRYEKDISEFINHKAEEIEKEAFYAGEIDL